MKVFAIVLLVASDKERVNIPMWVGLAGVGAGAAMLLVPTKT